jgi:hypothetical protein
VIKQDTAVGVDIRPRILDFTVGFQDIRDDMVALSDQVDQWVVFDVFLSELFLMQKSGVCVSQNGVTVSGDDLSLGDGVDNEVLDFFVGDVVA